VNYWKVLGIAPTDNVLAIKKAYAARSKEVHPEEDPEGFIRLREAYESALAWAKRTDDRGTPGNAGFDVFPLFGGTAWVPASENRGKSARFTDAPELKCPLVDEIQEALENIDGSVPYVPPAEELTFEKTAEKKTGRKYQSSWLYFALFTLYLVGSNFGRLSSLQAAKSPPSTGSFQIRSHDVNNVNNPRNSPRPVSSNVTVPKSEQELQEEAFRSYRRFAAKGNVDAQYNLGLAYLLGRGVKEDCARAMYWFGNAAEAGNPSAQNNLAVMYEVGLGVLEDRAKAVELYETAARLGNAKARENLERLASFDFKPSKGGR
jgi:TPR repeat protein